MRPVYVDDLKGNEMLAEPVLLSDEVVLMQPGTVLKEEYINKLRNMNISAVYIKEDTDNNFSDAPDVVHGAGIMGENNGKTYKVEETAQDTEEKVKKILDNHIYKRNDDLKIIGDVANDIITSVISQPEVISNITEIRNISTDMYSHCVNVCTLSTIMALRLRMSKEQVHDVAMGAILHDIGLKYIQVPYVDLDLEDMKDSDAEEYKKHTIYGYSSIQDEKWISDISKEIILLHHEKLDGTGYPFHQKNRKIHTEVRLVSLCDDFDALISGIGSRKMKMYEAIEYIKVNSGTTYDSNVAKKLLDSVAVYPVGVKVLTNENEIGIVIGQNRSSTDRPIIKMLTKADGSEYKTECIKDLMKNLTVFIVDTL